MNRVILACHCTRRMGARSAVKGAEVLCSLHGVTTILIVVKVVPREVPESVPVLF